MAAKKIVTEVVDVDVDDITTESPVQSIEHVAPNSDTAEVVNKIATLVSDKNDDLVGSDDEVVSVVATTVDTTTMVETLPETVEIELVEDKSGSKTVFVLMQCPAAGLAPTAARLYTYSRDEADEWVTELPLRSYVIANELGI